MVYSQDGLPANTLVGLQRAGIEREWVFCPGFECLGVVIGIPGFVANFLETKLKDISKLVGKTCDLMDKGLKAQ